MKTDEKARDDQASAGDDSVGQIAEREEIIDLVDEVATEDDAGNVEQTRETASKMEDDEALIELTDVVAESDSEARTGDVTLELPPEETLEPKGEQASEEEELIELVDEVVPEAGSGQEEEELIELVDEVVPEAGSEQEEDEEEPIELTDEVLSAADSEQEHEEVIEQGDSDEGLGLDLEDAEEDSAADPVDLEMTEEGPEIPAEEEIEDPGLAMLEEAQESSVDTGETQPKAEDQAELGLKEGVPEAMAGALEQAVLEKLSDGRLEEIITSVVKQAIEGKVERILLEAAEAAIGKEIERLKQAL